VTVTVSVGVTALQADDRLFSHLLRRADRAMYAAKAAGRNRVMLDAGPG
jgi:diguanylate cyclase (GGDEF)-like protein